MTKRRFISIVLVIALVVVGCSMQSPADEKAGEEPEGIQTSENMTIGFSISTLNNPFFVTLRDGAAEAAEKAGVSIDIADAQNDSSKQLSDVEDMIQKGVDVLLINPTDSEAVVTAVQAANDANIPVITLDRGAEGGNVISHIASDNVAGGEMAAEYILEQAKKDAKVVELQGIAGTSAARDRGEGFNKKAEGQLEIVARQPADFDRARGLSVMENILQSQAEIDAVFAHNDEMALGASEAIENSGRDILVVGFDGTEDAIEAVKIEVLSATIAQQPAEIGKVGVETAVKVINGEEVEEEIPVELKLVTQDTVQ